MRHPGRVLCLVMVMWFVLTAVSATHILVRGGRQIVRLHTLAVSPTEPR